MYVLDISRRSFENETFKIYADTYMLSGQKDFFQFLSSV